MIWDTTGIQPGIIGAVLSAAFIYGLAYNAFVAWLNRTGRGEGYTSILVVAGTLVTLAFASILIGLLHTLLVLLVFVATGLPMVLGDLYRYTEARRKAREQLAATLREIGQQ